MFSYQWVTSNGTTDTDIPDATDSTYTLVADDQGKTIKVQVSFTDDEGNDESMTSAATEPVGLQRTPTTSLKPCQQPRPRLSGGRTLRGSNCSG